MNAQNTIKRLLKIFTRPKPQDDIHVIEQVPNDTNFLAQQLPTLSLSKPFMKFGKTIVQLQDASSKNRNDKHIPESGLQVRQLQSERHDNLNLELDDDRNSAGSPWQSTQLRDTSSKKRSNEHIPEPGVKVRRLKSEGHDNLTFELESDDSNTVCSPLSSLPVDDDDNSGSGGGGGGSTQAAQQVSQMGLPTENLSAYTVTPSDQMYIDGNVGTVSPSQQQFGTSGMVSKTSSVGQLVGSVPVNREKQFLGTLQTVSSVETQTVSSSSSSGLAVTSSELGDTSSQDVKFLSSKDSAVPVMAQQPTQNTIGQPQVYIPDSQCSSSTDEQGGLMAGSVSLIITPGNPTTSFSPQQQMLKERLELSGQLCSHEDSLQHQSIQQGQAIQHQQYTSLNHQKPIGREKSNETHLRSGFRPVFLADNERLKGSSDVLITTPSCVVLPQQQKLVSVNTSSSLKGKIGVKTASLLQLPAVEANQIAGVPPVMERSSQHIYISNPLQNNTSIVSDQQTKDFGGQHLYSSGHRVQAGGISLDTAVTATTSAVISAISSGRALAGVRVATVPTAGAVSLNVPTTLSMVTPSATSLMGIGVHVPSAADRTSVLSMGEPAVSRIGIIAPISNCTFDMVTATAPSSTLTTTSTFSTVTSVATSMNSTADPYSDSAVRVEIPSTFVTINEQTSNSPLTIGKSSTTTGVQTSDTVSSITKCSTPTSTHKAVTTQTDKSTGENRNNICEYCNQNFPEDIIVHHRKLHFRQRFFSCIVCGKNFRTEVGLENHRCENSADGHRVHAEGISLDAAVTATTSAVISAISSGRVATVPTAGAVSLNVPTTLSIVTPSATSLMGIGVHAPSAADRTSVHSMGEPAVSRIGISAPISNCTLGMVTATAPSSTLTTTSTFSTVTSVATSMNSTADPYSDSAVRVEIPSTFVTINEQTSNSPLTIGKSSTTTGVQTSDTVSSITKCSTPTSTHKAVTIKTDNSIEENRNNICEYCNQIFPEDIIVHHRKLHFRQRFFSCIVCGKNFRTEVGLENHRCENSAE
ncbi:uncharacterized protein LOC111874652 isoform X2 [Cryptotermes secundus]|nr:uncharacterized protein LOC111874652 isoform X2 [Cryptotermes secundus]